MEVPLKLKENDDGTSGFKMYIRLIRRVLFERIYFLFKKSGVYFGCFWEYYMYDIYLYYIINYFNIVMCFV